MNGRPLRFLGLVLGGWVALRAAMLWPTPVAPPRLAVAPNRGPVLRYPELEPLALRGGGDAVPPPASWTPRYGPAPPQRLAGTALVPPLAARWPLVEPPAVDRDRAAVALLALARFEPSMVDTRRDFAILPLPEMTSRWSGSAWLIARDDGGVGLGAGPLGGQLGGSQAGARLAYRLEDRLALVGRVAAPLRGRGSEAAVGLEWRADPHLRLVAEQRVAIDGAGGGPALGVIGGFGPARIRGFRLEAYGQAGVIGRGRGVYYVDGAARAEAPIARRGGVELGMGAGVWGAAQTGAERLDIGPTIGATLPVARQRLRLTLDWRARVAGGAAPGSGPALSIGTDF